MAMDNPLGVGPVMIGGTTDVRTQVDALIVTVKRLREHWLKAAGMQGLPTLLKAKMEGRAEEDEIIAVLLSETLNPTVLSRLSIGSINTIIIGTMETVASSAIACSTPQEAAPEQPEQPEAWDPAKLIQET